MAFFLSFSFFAFSLSFIFLVFFWLVFKSPSTPISVPSVLIPLGSLISVTSLAGAFAVSAGFFTAGCAGLAATGFAVVVFAAAVLEGLGFAAVVVALAGFAVVPAAGRGLRTGGLGFSAGFSTGAVSFKTCFSISLLPA
ncbi:hypothetical protein EPI11_15205 [Flavobacterium cerinum]|uniref:Uncharacterized protein n=1 Tax=Flavobacterium cerinum TaxID=2502784 RepID=A0A3S3QU74_9FLAO|nr:hypothetical protein EPI11_15205 [Flavobacterium cerinum]